MNAPLVNAVETGKKHKKIKGRKRDYSKGTSENLWL